MFRNGVIRYRFYPDFSVLTLEASAPGYDPTPVPVEISQATQVDVGKIHLKKKIEEIAAKPAAILPIDFQPPPVTDVDRSFGAPR